MSNIDQCPSSKKEGKPVDKGNAAHLLAGAGMGQAYWRSLDELADTPEFRERLHREFPSGASELLEGGEGTPVTGESRRDFLKLMGASFALAGVSTLAACRRPDHKIMPYAKNVPEEVIPGRSLYYATSMPLPGGGAEGLLVETHEGRPTKVEGNPLHSINQGKSSTWSQASVLNLYDPDRLAHPMYAKDAGAGVEATWDDFAMWWKRHASTLDAKGKGVAVVYDKAGGPTREAVVSQLKAKWPEAEVFGYDALENENAIEGSKIAFGSPMREVLSIEKAAVIVSLDRDFLQFEPGAVRNSRAWGATRQVYKTSDTMSRLYCVESGFSITGAAADHRLALAPSLIPNFAAALAKFILAKRAIPASKGLADALAGLTVSTAGIDQKFIDVAGQDLCDTANAGKTLVVCGRSQPPQVHALVAAINAALECVGKTVSYVPASADEGVSSLGKICILADKMRKGEISTAVFLSCNPVFTAPASCDFAGALAKVKTRVALSVDANETVAASHWRLNGCHYMEAWGDTEALDGSISPIQPMIAPLFGGKSDIELIAMLAGNEKADGHELVQSAWKAKLGDKFSEKAWKRALFDGVLAGTVKEAKGTVDFAKVAASLPNIPMGAAPTEAKLDVVFSVAGNYDGRFANNGWMQELPEPASHVVWDNPALISVKTAQKLGIMQTPETDKKPKGRMVELVVGGKTLKVACWAIPGLPDNTVILHPGSGRSVVGLVGKGVGFNTFALRNEKTPWVAKADSLTPVAEGEQWYRISCTQTHWSMEGRAIIREVDHQAWAKTDEKMFEEFRTPVKDAYGRNKTLNFAERIEGSELLEMPASVGVYPNPLNNSTTDAAPGSKYSVGPQWGMSIDLAKCTGCNVCTIACQSENNIPVVGKIEVNKGRELHWIRVDRYFRSAGDMLGHEHKAEDWSASGIGMSYQPVACVQCENAPCETVCPVNATVHGDEGHNYMTYNRCIGTRYCANNCPYKVRRFNFFDYGVAKFQGGLKEGIEESLPKAVTENLPENHNLIPPRLRKKLDEISKLGMNPNVTVRSRGVMEKCTYCVQRTNEAKIDFKLKNPGKRPSDGMPDGMVQTACQQACPTDAISFGDILDKTSNGGKGSKIRHDRDHQRSYMLLGFLNTRPRTTYMIGMKNPHKDLREPVMNPLGEVYTPGHGGHGGGVHEPAPAHGEKHADASGGNGYRLSLPVLNG